MSILDKLKSERHIVGVSLTPGLGLEAVVLDKTKKIVEKYGKKNVLYNFSTREIQNMNQFKSELAALLTELEIPAKAEINIVLPNILFEFFDISAEVPNESIGEVILNKAEEFYLFKREEPVSGFCEVVNFSGGTDRRYAYTSFQKNVTDQIKDIVSDLGYNIVGIETSYSALLRGLYLTGLIDRVCIEQEAWTLMLVNSNSYTLIQMEGKNIVSFNDVPLAIKSFSAEEAYQSIIQGSSQILANNITTKLYIVSQTDDISAEYLKKNIKFDREVVVIETNKFSTSPVMDVADSVGSKRANAMTLTAIGAASGRIQFPLSLNVLEGDPTVKSDIYRINISGQETEITGAQIDALSIIASSFLGVIGLIIVGALFVYGNTLTSQVDEIARQISDLDSQIQTLENKEKENSNEQQHEEVDVNSIIDEIAGQNVSAISFYDSISTDIPKNVWLTKYYNRSGKEISIKGVAESIVDIYEYYKNLRIAAPQSDIKLNELRVVTGDNKAEDDKKEESEYSKLISGLNINTDKDRLYSFEISNIQIPTMTSEKPADETNVLRVATPTATLEEPSQQMTPAQ